MEFYGEILLIIPDTVMIQSFHTNRSVQTEHTQIRWLLEEQSDQGLHCLLFHLHVFEEIPKGLASFLEFSVDYSSFLASENLGILRYSPNTILI